MVPQCKNSLVRPISREVDLAWLAGILDSDGNLYLGFKPFTNKRGVAKTYIDVKVRMMNTSMRTIKKVSQIYLKYLPGIKFFYSFRKTKNDAWRDQLSICVSSQGSVVRVLEAVMPYMVNKKDSAFALVALVKYVQQCPKGGNTASYNYTEDPRFVALHKQYLSEVDFYVDPSTTTRRANTEFKHSLLGDIV